MIMGQRCVYILSRTCQLEWVSGWAGMLMDVWWPSHIPSGCETENHRQGGRLMDSLLALTLESKVIMICFVGTLLR